VVVSVSLVVAMMIIKHGPALIFKKIFPSDCFVAFSHKQLLVPLSINVQAQRGLFIHALTMQWVSNPNSNLDSLWIVAS